MYTNWLLLSSVDSSVHILVIAVFNSSVHNLVILSSVDSSVHLHKLVIAVFSR